MKMGSFKRQQNIKLKSDSEDQLEKILNMFPELKGGTPGLYKITAWQIAAAFTKKGIPLIIRHLVLFGDKTVNVGDRLGRTPLYYAALNGNVELIKLLLDCGANIESKLQYSESTSRISDEDYHKWNKLYTSFPVPDVWGRTPLHEAVKAGHVDAVRVLIERNANINAEDDQRVTPLMLAGYNENREGYENILKMLIDKGADASKKNGVTGTTLLFQAVSLKSTKGVEILLKAGAWITQESCVRTELHEAAGNGLVDIVEKFLDHERITSDDINRRDECDRTPLYDAAYGGHKECIRMLIENGGDMGHDNKMEESVMKVLFTRISKPAAFINNILNFGITASGFGESNFCINLDFKTLAPTGNENQMNVITNILLFAKEDERIEILQHPLIEAYLHVKWAHIRQFFYLLICIYVTFVISLSTYVILFIHKMEQFNGLMITARYVSAFASSGLLGHAVIQCIIAHKKILRQYEMWMNFTCTTLSVIATTINPQYSNCGNNIPNWFLLVTSIAVLFAWFELMLLIGRSPVYGYYSLMFAAVLQNVVKVLLTFLCLVIGFAISFSIQFYDDKQFANPWRSFVKTTVMMMGEFEYTDLFSNESQETALITTTSRFIFLLFVILASIVLMNLMIGVAVSDIQSLQKEGLARRLEKQAEFLRQLEKVISLKAIDAHWFPAYIRGFLKRKRCIATNLVIQPERYGAVKTKSKQNRKFPSKLVESLVNVAISQQNLHLNENIFKHSGLPVIIENMKKIIQVYENSNNNGHVL